MQLHSCSFHHISIFLGVYSFVSLFFIWVWKIIDVSMVIWSYVWRLVKPSQNGWNTSCCSNLVRNKDEMTSQFGPIAKPGWIEWSQSVLPSLGQYWPAKADWLGHLDPSPFLICWLLFMLASGLGFGGPQISCVLGPSLPWCYFGGCGCAACSGLAMHASLFLARCRWCIRFDWNVVSGMDFEEGKWCCLLCLACPVRCLVGCLGWMFSHDGGVWLMFYGMVVE